MIDYFFKVFFFCFLCVFLQNIFVLGAPWTPENAKYNFNLEPTLNPTLYYGEWKNHSYTSSFEDWRDHIIYHVLIDRYADGEPFNNDVGYDGYEPSSIWTRHGGDVKGLISKLDYIEALGVDILYISNPLLNYKIGYHGFHTKDFTLMDDRLGTVSDLRDLVNAVHQKGMRIIIDLPLNHMSDIIYTNGFKNYFETGNAPFSLHEKRYTLHYRNPSQLTYDDFFINNTYVEDYVFPKPISSSFLPISETVDFEKGGFPFCDFNHAGLNTDFQEIYNLQFGEFQGLDDLNTYNAHTKLKLLQMIKAFLASTDIDGFRLDASAHVDVAFWDYFSREIRLFSEQQLGKQNFLLVGEIFVDYLKKTLVGRGKDLEGHLMFNHTIFNGFQNDMYFEHVVTKHNLKGCFEKWQSLREGLDVEFKWENTIYNTNHDENRFLNKERYFKILLQMQLAFPGIPYVYYGEEQFEAVEAVVSSSDLQIKGEMSREDMFNSILFSEDKALNYSSRDSFDMTSKRYRFYQTLFKVFKTYEVFRRGDVLELLFHNNESNSDHGEVAVIKRTIKGNKQYFEEGHAILAGNLKEHDIAVIDYLNTGLKGYVTLPARMINVFNESEYIQLDENGIISTSNSNNSNNTISLNPLEAKVFVFEKIHIPIQLPFVESISPGHDEVVEFSWNYNINNKNNSTEYPQNNLHFQLTFTEIIDVEKVISFISFDNVPLYTNESILMNSSSFHWDGNSKTLSIFISREEHSIFRNLTADGIHYLKIEEIISAAANDSNNVVSSNVSFSSRVRIGNSKTNVLMSTNGTNILWGEPGNNSVVVLSYRNITDYNNDKQQESEMNISVKHYALGCKMYRVSVQWKKWSKWSKCPDAYIIRQMNRSYFETEESLVILESPNNSSKNNTNYMVVVQYWADVSASMFVYHKISSFSTFLFHRRFPDLYIQSHKNNDAIFLFPLIGDYIHEINVNESFIDEFGYTFTIFFKFPITSNKNSYNNEERIDIGEAFDQTEHLTRYANIQGRLQLYSSNGVYFDQQRIQFHEKNMTIVKYGEPLNKQIHTEWTSDRMSIFGHFSGWALSPMIYDEEEGLWKYVFIVSDIQCALWDGIFRFLIKYENDNTFYKAHPEKYGIITKDSPLLSDLFINCTTNHNNSNNSKPNTNDDEYFMPSMKVKSWMIKLNFTEKRYEIVQFNKSYFDPPKVFLCLDIGINLGIEETHSLAHRMHRLSEINREKNNNKENETFNTWRLLVFLTPEYKRIAFDFSGICITSLGLKQDNSNNTFEGLVVEKSVISGNTTLCSMGNIYRCPKSRVNKSGYYEILFDQRYRNYSITLKEMPSEINQLNMNWKIRSSISEWAPTISLSSIVANNNFNSNNTEVYNYIKSYSNSGDIPAVCEKTYSHNDNNDEYRYIFRGIFVCPASEIELKVYHEINETIMMDFGMITNQLKGFDDVSNWRLFLGGRNIIFEDCYHRPGLYALTFCLDSSLLPSYAIDFMADTAARNTDKNEVIHFVSTPHFAKRRNMRNIELIDILTDYLLSENEKSSLLTSMFKCFGTNCLNYNNKVLYYIQTYNEDPSKFEYLFDLSDNFEVKIGRSWTEDSFNMTDIIFQNGSNSNENSNENKLIYSSQGIGNGQNFLLNNIPAALYTILFDPSSFMTYMISPQIMYVRGDFNGWGCTKMERESSCDFNNSNLSIFSECFHQWKVVIGNGMDENIIEIGPHSRFKFDSSCDWKDSNYFGASVHYENETSYTFSENGNSMIRITGKAQYMSFKDLLLNVNQDDKNNNMKNVGDKTSFLVIQFNDITLEYGAEFQNQYYEKQLDVTGSLGIIFSLLLFVFMVLLLFFSFHHSENIRKGSLDLQSNETLKNKMGEVIHKNDDGDKKKDNDCDGDYDMKTNTNAIEMKNFEKKSVLETIMNRYDNLSDSQSTIAKKSDPYPREKDKEKIMHVTMEYSIPNLGVKAMYGGLGKVVDLFIRRTQPSLFCCPFFSKIDHLAEVVNNNSYQKQSGMSGIVNDCFMEFVIDTGLQRYDVKVVEYRSPRHSTSNGAVFYLIKCCLFDGKIPREIYRHGSELDELEYFSVFSQSVANVIEYVQPKHVHYHDYHGSSASILLLLRTSSSPYFRKNNVNQKSKLTKLISSSMTIHNGHYQGVWNAYSTWRRKYLCRLFNVPLQMFNDFFNDGGNWNLLNSYISYCTRFQNSRGLCSVSKRYADFVKLKFPIFWPLECPITPIMNAVDENEKPILALSGLKDILKMKLSAKLEIQRLYNMNVGEEYDLLVFLGRQSYQKGMDIAADRARRILRKFSKSQIIMVGPVEDQYGQHTVDVMLEVERSFPGRAYAADRMVGGHEKDLLIKATDFLLCPSRFEPCGLVDIEFGWYGALGIGFSTGGLGKMPGFYTDLKVDNYLHSKRMFYEAVKAALKSSRDMRRKMMEKALKREFSVSEWEKAYQKLWGDSGQDGKTNEEMVIYNIEDSVEMSTKSVSGISNHVSISNVAVRKDIEENYEEALFIERFWKIKNNISSSLVKSRSKAIMNLSKYKENDNESDFDGDDVITEEPDDFVDHEDSKENKKPGGCENEEQKVSKLKLNRNNDNYNIETEQKNDNQTESKKNGNEFSINVLVNESSPKSNFSKTESYKSRIELLNVNPKRGFALTSSTFQSEISTDNLVNLKFEGDNVLVAARSSTKLSRHLSDKGLLKKKEQEINDEVDIPSVYYFFLIIPALLILPSVIALGYIYNHSTFNEMLLFGTLYYLSMGFFSTVWTVIASLFTPKETIYCVFFCGFTGPFLFLVALIGLLGSDDYIFFAFHSNTSSMISLIVVAAIINSSQSILIGLNMLTLETSALPFHQFLLLNESSKYVPLSAVALLFLLNIMDPKAEQDSLFVWISLLTTSFAFLVLFLVIHFSDLLPKRYNFKALDFVSQFSRLQYRKVAILSTVVGVFDELSEAISIGIALILLKLHFLDNNFEISFALAMVCSFLGIWLLSLWMRSRKGQKHMDLSLFLFCVLPGAGLLRSIWLSKTTGVLFIMGYTFTDGMNSIQKASFGLLTFQTLTRELLMIFLLVRQIIGAIVMALVLMLLKNDVLFTLQFSERNEFLTTNVDYLIMFLIVLGVLRNTLIYKISSLFEKETLWKA